MKKLFYSVFILFIYIGCVASVAIIDDDFLSDLASENNRIAGVLYLEKFQKNLNNLKYDYYVGYLKQNESPSAKGLIKKIQIADSHYFKTKKNSFLILLYYKKDKIIIGDNSQTAFIDTVIRISANTGNPSLENLAKKMNF